MKFLSRLRKVKDTTIHAVEETAECSKKKLKELSLQRQIEKSFCELGKKTYTLYQKGIINSTQLDTDLKKVQDLIKQFEEHKNDYRDKKTKNKKCAKCKATIEEGALFCTECGMKIES